MANYGTTSNTVYRVALSTVSDYFAAHVPEVLNFLHCGCLCYSVISDVGRINHLRYIPQSE